MSNKKSDFLYIVRGLGIMIVVAMHTYGAATLASRFYAMPLFFFVSGLSFRRIPFGTFLKKRVLRLYVPFVIYELVYLLLLPVLDGMGLVMEMPTSVSDYANHLVHIALFDNMFLFLTPFWFVVAIFFAQIIVYGIDLLLSLLARIIPGKRSGAESQTGGAKKTEDDYAIAGKWVKGILGIALGLVLLNLGLWCGETGWLRIEWSMYFKEAAGVILMGAGYLLMGLSMKDLSFFTQAFGEEKTSKRELSKSSENVRADGATGVSENTGFKLHIWRVIALVGFAWILYFNRLHNPIGDMKSNSYDFRRLEPLLAMLGIFGMIEIAHIVHMITEKTVIAKLLKYLGRISFSIMILNYPIIKLICVFQVYVLGMDGSGLSGWQFVDGSLQWQTIYYLGGLLIPAVLVFLVDTIKKSVIKRRS